MPAIPAQWLLGHHKDNPYFAFTDACNAEGVQIILASGQACVWYRLTLASKDGDWLIRESDAACAVVLNQLATLGARYRLGAPLHPRWLQAGWSSHFEATDPSGLRLRFDFVSRPPRIISERLAQIWQESESGLPAVVQPLDLVKLKRTMRLKDYPFIGALAHVVGDPLSQLACFCPFLSFFPDQPFGALKTATVAQLQGARCDGMAHAISSFVQRCRWVADAVFRMRGSGQHDMPMKIAWLNIQMLCSHGYIISAASTSKACHSRMRTSK